MAKLAVTNPVGPLECDRRVVQSPFKFQMLFMGSLPHGYVRYSGNASSVVPGSHPSARGGNLGGAVVDLGSSGCRAGNRRNARCVHQGGRYSVELQDSQCTLHVFFHFNRCQSTAGKKLNLRPHVCNNWCCISFTC